jgi:oxygen-independent coproporphyrinogen-3 oxidase
MLNALRLNDGVPLRLFMERTGLAPSAIEPALQSAERRGLLAVTKDRLAPTALGRRFLSDLQALFMSEHHERAQNALR